MFETLANIIESLGMLDTMELLNVFLKLITLHGF